MFRKLVNLFRPNRLEAEIREELDFHRSQTSGSFGNVTLIQEQTRAASTVVWIETLLQDIRYGLRQLRKTPVLSAVAVLSLALGIGANTAIFSLVNAVLLRSLPVAHPEELSLLVKGDKRGTNRRGNFSFPFSQLLRKDAKSFSGVLITSQPGRSLISIKGTERTVTAENVSADYFSVLGLTPAAGRFFAKSEDEPGARDYAVISHGFWRRQFAMDPAAIGSTIEKNGDAVTIVGVAPPEFFGISVGSAVDVWTTLSRTSPNFRNSPGMNFLQLLGRRRLGVTEQAAQAEADALFQSHILDYTSRPGWTQKEKELVLSGRIVLEPGATGLSSLRIQYSKPLQLLFAITLFVLLVACANIANLLLARAAARRKEIAMRMAIGASRGRMTRQLITESLLLAGFGGALALWFAFGGARVLVTLMAGGRSDRLTLDYSPDWRVLLFSAAVSLMVGILFGVAPALRSIRGAAMNERSQIGEARRYGVGKLLISFQVALTIVLVVGAGLFLRTLLNLRSTPLGFDTDRLYKVEFSFRKGVANEDRPVLLAQLPDRLASTPGVISASLVLPWGGGWTNDVSIPSYSATQKSEVYRYITAPDFFATMRIPFRAGRDFARQDKPASPQVAIINETMAKLYFGGRNPIGQFIQFPGPVAPSQIVGVAADSRVQGLRRDPPPIAYTPLAQRPGPAVFGTPAVILRLADHPPDMARELIAIHPGLRFEGGIFVKQQIEDQLVQERILALLSSFFGGLAMLLACIGLYGILSYMLLRRTTEIGVRLALGSPPRQIVRMVLRESALVVVLGLAAGLAGALALSRLVRQFLFGLEPNDPSTILIAAATLSLVALLAAFLPARRASRLDPMTALRTDQ